MLCYKPTHYTRVLWKVLSLAYNRCETRDKWSLGRDPDRSWCYLHTRVKLFWSQPMAPWTLAAANECYSSVHGSMGCDQESFILVWWWHQLLSWSLPMADCLKFHIDCRLGQILFTLSVCTMWRCLYSVFSYIYSLLIEKDSCDRQNVSVKLPCVYVCLSSGDFLNFFSKSFLFLFLLLCYPYFGT